MNPTFPRNSYINKIRDYIDKPIIKVITGMRRCGKSYILNQIKENLINKKVKEDNIILINTKFPEFNFIKNYKDLYNFSKSQFGNSKNKKYLLIDEVQEIEDWEKAIISFFAEGYVDIYITSSNANLLSSDLSTLLSGRYIIFPVYCLSFPEYLIFNNLDNNNLSDGFINYLKFGGLPELYHLDNNEEIKFNYLQSFYDSIILRGVINNHQLRNVNAIDHIALFIFENIGVSLSANKIVNYLKSKNINIGLKTVQNYIEYILSTFILHKLDYVDITDDRILDYNEKYYLGDIGLRHAVLGKRRMNTTSILKNIVFLELKRRGYKVSIGKIGKIEVDFVATKSNEKYYIQVAKNLNSQVIINLKFTPLKNIPNNYPKFVISMDTILGDDHEGINCINLVRFLLQDTKTMYESPSSKKDKNPTSIRGLAESGAKW